MLRIGNVSLLGGSSTVGHRVGVVQHNYIPKNLRACGAPTFTLLRFMTCFASDALLRFYRPSPKLLPFTQHPLLSLLTFILAAVVGGAPLPKESLTLKTLFWVAGDGVTTAGALLSACTLHARPFLSCICACRAYARASPRPDQPPLPGIRNPVTRPPCCSCGSAHALPSRVEPRAASFRQRLATPACTALQLRLCSASCIVMCPVIRPR